MRKKLLSLLWMLMVALTASSITTVMDVDFESGIPTGWSQDTSLSVNHQAWLTGTGIAVAPQGNTTNYAYLLNPVYATRSKQYVTRLITPVLNCGGIFQPRLIFKHGQPSNQSGGVDTLRIYYRTGATEDWLLLTEYTSAISVWQQDTVLLISPNNAYQLAFEGSVNEGLGVYIDDVKILSTPQCPEINAVNVTARSNAADVNIGGAGTAESFKVLVSTTRISDWSQYNPATAVYYNAAIEDFDFTVTGLQPQTNYYLHVSAACDDDPSGYAPMFVVPFRTSLGFPMTEAFTASIPSDWQRCMSNMDSAYAGVPMTTNIVQWEHCTQTSIFGGNHAYGLSATSYQPMWLISPTIDLASVPQSSAIDLRFDLAICQYSLAAVAASTQKNMTFYVLVSEDGQTWTRANTYTWSSATNADYDITETPATGKRYRINMNKYIGKVVKIAFVSGCTAGSSYSGTPYFHVGNIAINEYDAQCGDASKMTVIASTVNSLTASWNIMGKQNAIIELYSDATYTTRVDSQYVVTGTTYTFTGLTSGTTYYIRLRQDCQDAEWVKTSGRTAIGIPYTNVFSGSSVPEGWTRYQGVWADDVMAGSAVLPSPAISGWSFKNVPAAFTGMTGGCAYTNIWSTQKNWLVSPDIYLTANPGESVRVTFKHALSKSNSAATAPEFADTDDVFQVLISTDGGNTWLPQNAHSWRADGTGDEDYTGLTQFPVRYSMDVTSFLGQSIKVALFGGSQTSGSDNFMLISDFAVETYDPNCGGLSNLSVAQDSLGNATISWVYAGTQSAELVISTSSEFTDTLVHQVLTTTSYTLSSLSSNKQYYVKVRQNCEAAEWTTTSFRTPCGFISTFPWSENFDALAANAYPDCWTRGGTTTSSSYNWCSSTTKYYGTEGKSLRFESYSNSRGNTGIIATPAIDLNSDLTLSFWYRNVKGGEFQVWLNDSSTILASGLTGTSDWTYKEINLKPYRGQMINIVFYAVSNYGSGEAYIYLDDVRIDPASSCDPIDNVTVSSILSNGATIKHSTTNATQYQVMISTVELNLDSLEKYTTEIVFNQLLSGDTHPISGPEFTSNTQYYAYVRGFCGGSDYGKWGPKAAFRTLCAPVTPQAFGEESFSDEGNFECWTTGFMTIPDTLLSQNSAYARRNVTAAFGAYLQLSKESANSSYYHYKDGAYAITGELDLGTDSINKYQVVFQAGTNSSSSTNVHRVSVGVVTNPSDLDTYTAMKIIDLPYASDSTTLSTYVVSFADYTGDYNEEYGRYVMFLSEAGEDSTNYVVIDNISFDLADGCQQLIELAVDSATTSGARLRWENVQAMSYDVFVSPYGGKADTIPASSKVFTTTVNTNIAYLTGLNASAKYYAYVRANCDAESTSKWSGAKSFSTAIGIPFVDSLRTLDNWTKYAGKVSDLFNGGTMQTTTSGWAVGSAKTIEGITGAHPYYNLYGTSANYMLVSKPIDLSGAAGNDIALKLNMGLTAYSSGTPSPENQSFWVLVSTDNGATWAQNNAYSVSELPTADFDINNSLDIAYEYTFYLSKFAGQTILLALAGQQTTSGGDNYIHVANINLDTCAAMPFLGVSGATFTNVGLTSADMTFVTKATDVATYQYMYGVSGFDTTGVAAISTTQTTVTLLGLTASTVYDVYVRGISTKGEVSAWVGPVQFMTQLGLPFAQSFNLPSIPSNWTQAAGAPSAAFTGTAPTVGGSSWKIFTSDNGLPHNNVGINIYGSNNNKWLISPAISLSNSVVGDSLTFQFDFAYTAYNANSAPSSSSKQTLWLLVSEDGGATWAQANSWAWTHEDSTAATIYSLAAVPATGATYAIDFSRFATKSIKFAFVAATTSGDNDFHIANVAINKYVAGCETPTDLAQDAATQTSATISWTGNTAHPTVVEIASNDEFSVQLRRDTVASGLSYTINDLTASKYYYVRIKQICTATDETGYSNTLRIATECAPVSELPFTENFNDVTSKELPICWDAHKYQAAMAAYPCVSLVGGYANSNSLQFNGGAITTAGANTEQTAILPEFAADLSTLRIQFTYKGANADTYGNLIVGTMTQPSDTASFVAIDTLDKVSVITDAEVMLTSAPANHHYIAIRFAGGTVNSSYYVDNVKVSLIPTCLDMKQVSVDSVTAYTAKLILTNTGAANYEVVLADQAINPADTAAASHIVFRDATFTTDTIMLTGLQPATTYFAYARGICSETDKGAWNEVPALFVTECASFTVPYTENFDDVVTSALPMCWDADNNCTQSYYAYDWGGATGGRTGKCLRLQTESYTYMYDLTYNSELYTPVYNIDQAINTSYYIKNSGGASYMVLAVVDGTQTDTIFSSNTKYAAWTKESLDLNAYVGHEVQLQFVVEVNVGYDYSTNYIYLDDITIEPIPATHTVLSVTASNITRREMDLAWTIRPGSVVSKFDLVCSDSIVTDSMLNIVPKITVTDTTGYHLTGLDRGTTYFIYVRSNDSAMVGEWVSTIAKTKTLNYEEEIIIADGTVTNGYLPIYGYYADAAQHNQMIYPASMLTELQDQVITKMHFYVASGSNTGAWDNATFNFRLGTTTAGAISSGLISTAGTSQVYSGNVTATTAQGMDVLFPSSYTYTGGNLLLDVELPEAATYSSATFYGISTTASQGIYTYSTYSYTQSFLPKVAMTVRHTMPACPAVQTVTPQLTGDGTSTATISWTAAEGDYANTYDLYIGTTDTIPLDSIVPQYTGITALSYELTGLDAATQYYAYVRVRCDAEGHDDGSSVWNYAGFSTNSNCPAVHDLASVLTAKNAFTVSWNLAYEEQTPAFCYVQSTTQLSDSALEAATPTQTTALSVDFPSMAYGTTYYTYVASVCGAEHSPYTMTQITTSDACPAVADLRAEKVAFNAVSLAWNRAEFAEEAMWEVGIVGMEQYAQVTNDSAAILFGLNAETQYTAYVKAICATGDTSVVANLVFTTSPEPLPCTEIGQYSYASYTTPFDLYYKNAWVQSIYTADQVGRGGEISSLWFHLTSTDATFGMDEFNIYLGHTDIAVATASDWVPQGNLELVFSDAGFTFPADTGWMEIQLQNPFIYNGTDNLALVCSHKAQSYSSAIKCAYTTGQSGVVLYRNNDSDPTYGEYPSEGGTTSSSLADMQVCFVQEACAKPTDLTVANLTGTEAKLTWLPGGSERQWNTVLSTTELTDAQLAVAQMDTVSVLENTYTGLLPDQDYYFYVRSCCSATLTGSWASTHFITIANCKTPINFAVDSVTATTAKVTWSDANTTPSVSFTVAWGLSLGFDLNDPATYQQMIVTDTFYNVTGLTGNHLYKFAVRAADATESSRWTTPIEVRTACGIETLPFVEHFEDQITGIPACWTLGGTATDDNYNWNVYATGYLGKCVRFNSYNLSTGQTGLMTTPVILVDTAATLSFMYKNPAGGNFKVSINGTTVLDNLVNQVSWAEEEIDLTPYVGQTIQICFEATSNYGSGDAYIYVDELKILKASGCARPTITADNISLTSADLNWTGLATVNYMLELADNAGFTLNVDTIMVNAATTYALTNMPSGATRFARVRAICAVGDTSKISKPIKFTTKYGIPFAQDFNGLSGVPANWGNYDGNIFSGELTEVTTSYNGWLTSDAGGAAMTTTHMYSSVYSGYVWTLTTPEIMLNAQPGYGVRMTFNMAMTGTTTSSTAPTASMAGRMMAVAISTDGGNTWNVDNAYTWADTGTEGTYADIPSTSTKYAFDLTDYAGQSIMIAFCNDAEDVASYSSSYIHIDDVVINEYNANCLEVTNLTVSNVSMNGAQVDFGYSGATKNAVIALSKSAAFDPATAVLVDTIYNDSTYTLPALDPSTKYYLFVAQLCSPTETSAWSQVGFSSPIGVPYYPEFGSGSMPEGWIRSNTEASAVFGGTAMAPYTGGWNPTAASAAIPTEHARVNIYGSSCHYWMVTPSIDMTRNVGSGILLTFDAALCQYYNETSAPTETGTDDIFMVAVSTDNGATWQRRNATLWQDTTGAQYSFAGIPVGGQSYRLDMSAYAGKVVKIGFYGESTVSGGDNYLHVGNIALTTCQATTYTAAICYGQTYNGHGFNITQADYEVGENSFSRYTPATGTTPESLEVLALTVYPITKDTIRYTSCAGEPVIYDEHIQLEAGEVKVGMNTFIFRLTGSNTCDSVIYFMVNGLPVERTSEQATTCEGVPYMWHGKELYMGGSYSDTLSTVLGCDSICTLLLTVVAVEASDTTATVCYGDSLYIEGQLITKSGDYIEHFTTPTGCPAERKWHVTVVPELTSSHTETICKGESYTDDLFIGLTKQGEYTTTTISSTGCDSTVTLYLLVIDAEDPEQYITYYTKDLPLIIGDSVVLPVGTEPGEYTYTVETECGTVTYHITLTVWQSLDEITVGKLSVSPNPVAVGEDIRILTDFTDEELSTMTVEVYTAAGAMIYRSSEQDNLVIPGLPSAGVHMVRVTTAKSVYVSTLIVK